MASDEQSSTRELVESVLRSLRGSRAHNDLTDAESLYGFAAQLRETRDVAGAHDSANPEVNAFIETVRATLADNIVAARNLAWRLSAGKASETTRTPADVHSGGQHGDIAFLHGLTAGLNGTQVAAQNHVTHDADVADLAKGVVTSHADHTAQISQIMARLTGAKAGGGATATTAGTTSGHGNSDGGGNSGGGSAGAGGGNAYGRSADPAMKTGSGKHVMKNGMCTTCGY
jgi:hypothetical protein